MDSSKRVPFSALIKRPKHEVGRTVQAVNVRDERERIMVESPKELYLVPSNFGISARIVCSIVGDLVGRTFERVRWSQGAKERIDEGAGSGQRIPTCQDILVQIIPGPSTGRRTSLTSSTRFVTAKEARRSAGPNGQPYLCQYTGPKLRIFRDVSLYVRALGGAAPEPYLAGQRARVASVEGLRRVRIITPILGGHEALTYSSLLPQFHDTIPNHLQCVEIKIGVPGLYVSEKSAYFRSPRQITLSVADIKSSRTGCRAQIVAEEESRRLRRSFCCTSSAT